MGEAAVEVVGTVAGYMLAKLDKRQEAQAAWLSFQLLSLHDWFSLSGCR